MSSEFDMPHFENESKEADWWFDHREEHDRQMAKAMDEGRTFTMKDLLAQRGVQGPRVEVPLDFDDVVRAREQAAARGVDVEVYLRELMHQALLKNDAA